MNAVENVVMQVLTKLLTPPSPAFGNSLPYAKDETITDVLSRVEVGDVLFTRTNSSLYQAGRRILGIKYDHVSVVINQREVIHISPPVISKIDIRCMVHQEREPLIYRMALDKKDELLDILNNYLGERYNL